MVAIRTTAVFVADVQHVSQLKPLGQRRVGLPTCLNQARKDCQKCGHMKKKHADSRRLELSQLEEHRCRLALSRNQIKAKGLKRPVKNPRKRSAGHHPFTKIGI